ncbi:MAG TPA: hypothetical protein VN727_15195 [Candidatus Binatia bacterium]|nr:hypothetical protein [Candidatus Binatia bacterium]
MSLALRAVGIVIGLVALRLMFLPPVPAFYKRLVHRWGKRTTIAIGTCSLAIAAILILISRR